MSLELDANVDKDRSRTIVLAGKEWIVCPLPLRQVIAIGPLLAKCRGVSADTLAPETFDPMIEVVERALKKAYPGVTRDDLLDLPISLGELMEAITVIVEQSGGKRVDPSAGEA